MRSNKLRNKWIRQEVESPIHEFDKTILFTNRRIKINEDLHVDLNCCIYGTTTSQVFIVRYKKQVINKYVEHRSLKNFLEFKATISAIKIDNRGLVKLSDQTLHVSDFDNELKCFDAMTSDITAENGKINTCVYDFNKCQIRFSIPCETLMTDCDIEQAVDWFQDDVNRRITVNEILSMCLVSKYQGGW